MVNPLLESFGEPPRIRAANSSRPLTDLKGKGNPDLPSVCSNYWPPNVAQFVFKPFGTFDLSATQVCNPLEIYHAHSQHPSHRMVPN